MGNPFYIPTPRDIARRQLEENLQRAAGQVLPPHSFPANLPEQLVRQRRPEISKPASWADYVQGHTRRFLDPLIAPVDPETGMPNIDVPAAGPIAGLPKKRIPKGIKRGPIPRQLAPISPQQINPEDYFRFDKLQGSISDENIAQLRGLVQEQVAQSGGYPKTHETFQQIAREAREIDPEILPQIKVAAGETLDPRVRFAMREQLNRINSDLNSARKQLTTGSLPPAERDRLGAAAEILERDAKALIDRLYKTRTQDGRNLVFHRMMAGMREGFDLDYWLNRARRAKGGPLDEATENIIGKIVAAGRTAEQAGDAALRAKKAMEMAKLFQSMDRSGLLETIQTLRKAGLLTGLKTQLRNIGGNTAWALFNEISRGPAAIADIVMSASSGQRTLTTNYRGLLNAGREGATRGFREAWEIMRRGATQEQLARFDSPRELNTVMFGTSRAGEMANSLANGYTRLIFRTMAAGDRPFRAYAFRRALEERATIMARHQLKLGTAKPLGLKSLSEKQRRIYDGLLSAERQLDNEAHALLTPSELSAANSDTISGAQPYWDALEKARKKINWSERISVIQKQKSQLLNQPPSEAQVIDSILSNPRPELIAESIADSEVAVFAERGPLLEWLQTGRKRLRVGGQKGGVIRERAGKSIDFSIDMLMPFASTPSNIIKRALESSPVGLAAGVIQAAPATLLKKLTPDQQRTYAQMIGRGLTGSAVMGLGYSLAQEGVMSGLPARQPKERAMERAERLPGALLINGEWQQVSSYSPIGNLLTLGATLFEEGRRLLAEEAAGAPEYATTAAGIIGETALEQPFLLGTKSLVEALRSPERSGERFASQMLGSFVPTMAADIGRATDLYRRRYEGVSGGAKERWPGTRKDLPIQTNIFGLPEYQTPQAFWNPGIGKPSATGRQGITGLAAKWPPVKTEMIPSRNPGFAEMMRLEVGFAPVSKRQVATQDQDWGAVGAGAAQIKKGDEGDEERELRGQVLGMQVLSMVNQLIQSPGYQGAPDEVRKKALEQTISTAQNLVSQVIANTNLPPHRRMERLMRRHQQLYPTLAAFETRP